MFRITRVPSATAADETSSASTPGALMPSRKPPAADSLRGSLAPLRGSLSGGAPCEKTDHGKALEQGLLDKSDDKEVKILNRLMRVVHLGADEIQVEYEADPRHVEIMLKQLDIEGEAYGEPINAFFGDLDDLHIVAPSAHFLHQDDLDLELTSEVKRIFEAHTPGGPLPNTAELYTWCIPVAITDEEANLSGAICSFESWP